MAYCANCGKQIADAAVSCPECGHPTGQVTTSVVGGGTRTEGLATTSLVLGIAGFFVCPLVLHILAIVFGNRARTRIQNDPSLQGDGMAKAGVILGWIGIAYTVVLVIIFAAAFASRSQNFNSLGTHLIFR